MKTKTRILSLVLCLAMVIGYFTFGVSAAGETKTFEKVTTAPANNDWSGTYLIVYEAGNVAMNSTLTKFDAVGNTVDITISDNKIVTDVNNAFTIAKSGSGYSIQGSSGKYIGHGSDANGLTTGDSALVNTISINSDGTVNIIGSGGAYLRYNSASNQTRFRYYKSSSYTGQKAICLYKLVEGGGSETPVDPETCEHSYGAGVETTPATETTEGIMTYTCTLCGTTKTEAIPMLEPTEKSTFVKVTEAPTDWSGTYLIVCEDKNLVFDGSLTTLDAANDYQSVSITDSKIKTSKDYVFTISKIDDGYTIKSNSGYYIGQTSDANGLKSNTTTTYSNALSMNDDGTVNIVSGGAYLRFNDDSNSMRFRYYKSGTYTGQEPITLYKLESESTDTSEPVVGTGMSAYLSLESEVFLNVNFTLENVGDVEPATLANKVGLLVWDASATPEEAQATIDNCSTVLTNAVWNAERGRYVVRTEGIPAKKMGDLISFRPYYITEDGTYVYGRIISNYSPKTYCYNMLDPAQDTETDNDALMIAILNYGAAAQKYFGYHTEDLMNADLSPEQKTISWDGSLVRTDWDVPAAKEGTLTRNEEVVIGRGGFLSLEGAIDYNFYIRVSESVTVDSVKLLSWNEDTYNSLTTLTADGLASAPDMVWNATENRYEYKFEGRAAKTMFSPIYACAVVTDTDGNVYYGGVLAYSPERFAYEHADEGTTLAELAKCLVIYGDAARDYFNK